MICKNCGMEVAEGSRFCTSCGAPLAQEPAPVQDPLQSTVQSTVQEPAPAQPVNGNVPPQPMGGEVPPQPMGGEVPSQPVDGNVPPQPVQGGFAPRQPMVNGVPMNNAMDAPKKNMKPLIFIGVGVVAVIAVIAILATTLFSNMGYKGTLNKLEKAINNQDAELAMECYPDFYFDDDADDDDVMENIGFGKDEIKVDFEVVNDEEVTDEDCSLNYGDSTWQEYITEYYEDHCDDYDGEEVTEVMQAKVKLNVDTDSDIDDFYNAILKLSKVKMIFAKVDGKWYFFKATV